MSGVREGVIRAITECFGCDAAAIGDDTIADDVEGWDSLGHTVLMMRIEKILDIQIPEIVAANAANVGELVAALEKIKAKP
jgi:acyl carrier protein